MHVFVPVRGSSILLLKRVSVDFYLCAFCVCDFICVCFNVCFYVCALCKNARVFVYMYMSEWGLRVPRRCGPSTKISFIEDYTPDSG